MLFCPKCGHQNNASVKFCVTCGINLNQSHATDPQHRISLQTPKRKKSKWWIAPAIIAAITVCSIIFLLNRKTTAPITNVNSTIEQSNANTQSQAMPTTQPIVEAPKPAPKVKTAEEIELDKATIEFNKQDAILTNVYKTTMNGLSTDAERAGLKQLEIEWIKEKDIFCANESATLSGSTNDKKIKRLNCLTEYTIQRIGFLRTYDVGEE